MGYLLPRGWGHQYEYMLLEFFLYFLTKVNFEIVANKISIYGQSRAYSYLNFCVIGPKWIPLCTQKYLLSWTYKGEGRLRAHSAQWTVNFSVNFPLRKFMMVCIEYHLHFMLFCWARVFRIGIHTSYYDNWQPTSDNHRLYSYLNFCVIGPRWIPPCIQKYLRSWAYQGQGRLRAHSALYPVHVADAVNTKEIAAVSNS